MAITCSFKEIFEGTSTTKSKFLILKSTSLWMFPAMKRTGQSCLGVRKIKNANNNALINRRSSCCRELFLTAFLWGTVGFLLINKESTDDVQSCFFWHMDNKLTTAMRVGQPAATSFTIWISQPGGTRADGKWSWRQFQSDSGLLIYCFSRPIANPPFFADC